MQYRRSRAKDATFFFTIITHERKKILCQETNVALIREAFNQVVQHHPFRIRAFVLLPEHIHCIWTLSEDDNDFSMRWRLIKSYFSRRCNAEYKRHQSVSRLNKGEQDMLKKRFNITIMVMFMIGILGGHVCQGCRDHDSRRLFPEYQRWDVKHA